MFRVCNSLCNLLCSNKRPKRKNHWMPKKNIETHEVAKFIQGEIVNLACKKSNINVVAILKTVNQR